MLLLTRTDGIYTWNTCIYYYTIVFTRVRGLIFNPYLTCQPKHEDYLHRGGTCYAALNHVDIILILLLSIKCVDNIINNLLCLVKWHTTNILGLYTHLILFMLTVYVGRLCWTLSHQYHQFHLWKIFQYLHFLLSCLNLQNLLKRMMNHSF